MEPNKYYERGYNLNAEISFPNEQCKEAYEMGYRIRLKELERIELEQGCHIVRLTRHERITRALVDKAFLG